MASPSHHRMNEVGISRSSQERPEGGGSWFLSRKEIEESSPSRGNGIDLKKETYLRKSYCTFLQDLGMRLKVPQMTIATAIVFCHRFFLRQSHARNDRRTIATACMFLAGKVEESPRPLKELIIVSYEIIYKKDPGAVQRIKQKEVYEQQKELILLTERLVLTTLDFDLNLRHPYKRLVDAIKKFKVTEKKEALAQVAWNFVNDGLRTSLCLQFKPHHIAAGAIFLAAKYVDAKLPSDGDKFWWQEFDVSPFQLDEISNQMLELYEQYRLPPSLASEVEVSGGTVVSHRPPSNSSVSNDEHVLNKTKSQSIADHCDDPSNSSHNRNNNNNNNNNNNGSSEISEVVNQQNESEQSLQKENSEEAPKKSESDNENDEKYGKGIDKKVTNEAFTKIDKDKTRAMLEKRKKARGELPRKVDVMGEEDLIERVLEEGIELCTNSERKMSLSDQESPKTSTRKRKASGSVERE